MAHPQVVVGETYAFPVEGKRSLRVGKVTAVGTGSTAGLCRYYADGKYHYADTATARKPRTRKTKTRRRAEARGEYE